MATDLTAGQRIGYQEVIQRAAQEMVDANFGYIPTRSYEGTVTKITKNLAKFSVNDFTSPNAVRISQYNGIYRQPRFMRGGQSEVNAPVALTQGWNTAGAESTESVISEVLPDITDALKRRTWVDFITNIGGNAYTCVGNSATVEGDGSIPDLTNPITLPGDNIITGGTSILDSILAAKDAAVGNGVNTTEIKYEKSFLLMHPLVYNALQKELMTAGNLLSIQPYTATKIISDTSLVDTIAYTLGIDKLIITQAAPAISAGTSGGSTGVFRCFLCYIPVSSDFGASQRASGSVVRGVGQSLFEFFAPNANLSGARHVYAAVRYASARTDEKRVYEIQVGHAKATFDGVDPTYQTINNPTWVNPTYLP